MADKSLASPSYFAELSISNTAQRRRHKMEDWSEGQRIQEVEVLTLAHAQSRVNCKPHLEAPSRVSQLKHLELHC